MKLYARTPSGTGLGLDVQLTGQLKESDGTIRGVEVALPAGCDYVYGGAALSTAWRFQRLLWVDAGDICANDGATATQEELRTEVERVREKRRAEVHDGPLGPPGANYP